MSTHRSVTLTPPGRAILERSGLCDLEAVRLLLRGDSVIDWHRLAFVDYDEIERFLRVNEIDPDSEEDLNRLEELREEAVEYLVRNLHYRVPTEVAEGMPVPELFMLASQRTRRSIYACVVLKVMHVLHHLIGRELAFKLPISNDQLFGFVERKVVRVVEELRAAGYPIAEFAWSRKERDSLITKLLAKKATLAANIYDKLRFRLITRSREDLLPVLVELTHRLIPFNYVVPGESLNGIIDLRRALDGAPTFRRLADQLQELPDDDGGVSPQLNEFSGPAYRVINFVADLPVRVDSFLDHIGGVAPEPELGNVVFVLTEFQIVDAETARNNELGENSHAAYKERQHVRVKSRLTSGARGWRDRQANGAGPDDDDDDD